jgi:hypothetical protein
MPAFGALFHPDSLDFREFHSIFGNIPIGTMQTSPPNNLQIVNAVQERGMHFVVIEASVPQTSLKQLFRFGVNEDGYNAVQKIFESIEDDEGERPLCFFQPNVRPLNKQAVLIQLKLHRGREIETIEAEVPIGLAANLVWFLELDDWTKAEHLQVC